VTAKRAAIEISLAARGRPANWANEQEAAILVGFPADGQKFRETLPALEEAGFPPVMPFNGKRFIPAIERFVWQQLDSLQPSPEFLPQDIRPFEEILNDKRSSKRRAS
jgi:hypothetical protein